MDDTELLDAPPNLEQPVIEEYWGFDSRFKWYFPDNVQWIEFQVMDEGKKSRFQRDTNRDIRINRSSGDAAIKTDVAQDRHALLEGSVVDWYVYKDRKQVTFSLAEFKNWMSTANPKLVEDLEFAIRKANPWMQAEMSVEEIDKEISRLNELREQAVKREEEKASFSSR